MSRPKGSLRKYHGRNGESYHLKFSAYGKRRCLTLPVGTSEEEAWRELDRIAAEVDAGVWEAGGDTLDETIIRAMRESDSADPQELASNVLDELTEDQIFAEAEQLVLSRVRALIGRQRKSVSEDGVDLRSRFRVGLEWKILANLTSADCRAIAVVYQEKAQELGEKAHGMRRLADALDKAGVSTVRHLDPTQTAEALRGKQIVLRRPVAA